MTKHGAMLFAVLFLPLAAQAQAATHPRDRTYDNRHGARTYGSTYSPLSYTHGEVRLVAEDPDGHGTADGVSLAGSVLFRPELFATGAFTSLGNGGIDGFDSDTLELSVGLRHPYTSQVDLVGAAGIVHVDSNAGSRHDDDFGPSLTGGARVWLSPLFEIGAYANYTQIFGNGDLGVRGEGLYHITPNLSAVAGLGLSDSTRFANIGARWYFTPVR
jgi:hypothetical protein